MAALLVGVAILSLMLSIAMPVWRHEMQREREAELIFRGEQYVRAISLFQRKYPGTLPPNIEVLVTQKFLRKKYKDPMTEDGEFRLIAAGAQRQGPGQEGQQGQGVPGIDGAQPRQPPLRATVPPPMRSPGAQRSDDQQPVVSAGIIGVASKSKEKSIRLYKGRSKYDEWQFIFANIGNRPGAPDPSQPGQRIRPGLGPGGFPRPGRPGQPGRPGPRRPGTTPMGPRPDRPVGPGGPIPRG